MAANTLMRFNNLDYAAIHSAVRQMHLVSVYPQLRDIGGVVLLSDVKK